MLAQKKNVDDIEIYCESSDFGNPNIIDAIASNLVAFPLEIFSLVQFKRYTDETGKKKISLKVPKEESDQVRRFESRLKEILDEFEDSALIDRLARYHKINKR